MSAASYDGNGMRASATFTPSGGTANTQKYLWGGGNLLMDSSNAYIYAGGATAPVEQVGLATGAIDYLNTDTLGSVRGVVNKNGTLAGTTHYDAWGNALTTDGLTATTPFGFAGGYTDPDGLIYLINRYYDPQTGQLTSIDPEVSQTLLPYAYTVGDPVDQSDPAGMIPCCGSGGETYYSKRFNYALNFTYKAIKSQLGSWTFWTMRHMISSHHQDAAAALYALYVRQRGAWDLKVPLEHSHSIDRIRGERGEAPWYTRVTHNEQIYVNVWGNISFCYVGKRAGFPGWFLQAGGGLEGRLHRTDTPGNRIERQMGIDLYNVYRSFYRSEIEQMIVDDMPPVGRYCDFLHFPDASGACRRGEKW